MPNFAIPKLFVVPTGNTLPTGATSALTPGQFGIYLPTGVPATAGTAATAQYLQMFQGNKIVEPWVPNKRSDQIYPRRVKRWDKMVARTTVTPQITQVDQIELMCEEEFTLTLRLDSALINNVWWNGLTHSFPVKAPCCECGEDPCTSLTDADYDAIYADMMNQINNHVDLKNFITATVTGAGALSKLILTGKPLPNPWAGTVDPHNNPFRFDRLSFRTYLHKGPDVSQDFEVPDRCDIPGVVTVMQRAQYVSGSADEVKQMEKNYFSYDTTYKEIFCDTDYNGTFVSLVDAAFYDLYFIKFEAPENLAWHAALPEDEMVIIAVPTGTGAAIEAILVALFGAVNNVSSTGVVAFTPLVP